MRKKTENIIARDKKELSQFILDLCGFTLEKAGYNSETYSFYLHIAFRHQAVLQSKEWHRLCEEITEADPLTWATGKQDILRDITNFAQSIVTEVVEAQHDSWAIKLIKTSYLTQIDRAQKSCDYAIKFLNTETNKNPQDLSVSTFLATAPESSDELSQLYNEALKAQKSYLNSLLTLPFIIEKTCLKLADNKGRNYQPKRTVQMLAATLDTINEVLKYKKIGDYSTLKEAFKVVLAITMPEIQGIDDKLIDLIIDELLPYVNEVIAKSTELENAKRAIFPQNEDASDTEVAKARKAMFASLDVHFLSVQDILEETLIEPLEECSKAVSSGVGLVKTSADLFKERGLELRLTQLKDVFTDLDKVVTLYLELSPKEIPAWLEQANIYYQQLKKEASKIDAATQSVLKGIGTFYNYAASFIPEAVRNYLASADALTKVLKEIDDKPNRFEWNKVMAYFAFYELAKQSEFSEPLKAKFFNVYMLQIRKADEKLRQESFNYESYRLLEQKLAAGEEQKPGVGEEEQKRSRGVALKTPLAVRIENYEALVPKKKTSNSDDSSNSNEQTNYIISHELTSSTMLIAEQSLDIDEPRKLDIILLINRLKVLESEFDVNKPEATFEELADADSAAEKSEYSEHQAFAKEFLQPAMERMLAEYKKKHLVVLLEKMLDTPDFELGRKHRIRELYSKLREDVSWTPEDWTSFKEAREKLGDFKEEEFKRVLRFKDLLPLNEKKLINNEWSTAKEARIEKTEDTFDVVSPILTELLSLIRRRLDQQRDSCIALQQLVADGSKAAILCQEKINYIDALNQLINKLIVEIKNPRSETRRVIVNLLTGELAELSKQELSKRVSLASAPEKLIRFAWNVLPTLSSTDPKFNETFIYNLLDYYTQNTDMGNVLEHEKAYNDCLNAEPIPALMKELNDPLALTNLIPSQEKIMDAIIDKLIDASSKKAISWGTSYLKQAVDSIARENLVKFLPYPFLVDLALKAIKSETVQAKIAPIVNQLMSEYGGFIGEKADEIKGIAKNRLYPVLGIEIQKTVEASAYHYAKNPSKAGETDRDAFAMYYLQYREIRKVNPQNDSEKTIKFLFPELLKNKKGKVQQDIITAIKDQFTALDSQIESDSPIDETESLLEFLIQNLNLSDPDNEPLIRVALINRLLIMTMDASEQLRDQDKINELQQQAIEKLSAALAKIHALVPQPDTQSQDEELDFVIVPRPEENKAEKVTSEAMFHSLATANKRATKVQLQRLKQKLENTKTLVDGEIAHDEVMLNSQDPWLGISLGKWEYYQSKFSRRIFVVLSFLFELFSIISTWASILSPLIAGGGVLEAFLIAAGLSGVVGAGATGFGIAAVAGVALLRLSYKLGMEIWYHRKEFDAIWKLKSGTDAGEELSTIKKIGLTTLVVLKCLGLAIAKTIITDYLVAQVSELLAFWGPLERIRNAFRLWPSEQRVTAEKAMLDKLATQITDLQKLLDNQLKFLTGEMDPQTKEPFSDQSTDIDEQVKALKKLLTDTEQLLNSVSSNDARYVVNDYETTLNNFKADFVELNKEIDSLENLNKAQANISMEVPAPKVKRLDSIIAPAKIAVKPLAIVDIRAYSEKFVQPAPQETQAKRSFASRFFNYFSGTQPAVKVEKLQVDALAQPIPNDLLEKSVSMSRSSFFYVPIPPNKVEENRAEKRTLEESELLVIDDWIEEMLQVVPEGQALTTNTHDKGKEKEEEEERAGLYLS